MQLRRVCSRAAKPEGGATFEGRIPRLQEAPDWPLLSCAVFQVFLGQDVEKESVALRRMCSVDNDCYAFTKLHGKSVASWSNRNLLCQSGRMEGPGTIKQVPATTGNILCSNEDGNRPDANFLLPVNPPQRTSFHGPRLHPKHNAKTDKVVADSTTDSLSAAKSCN